MSALSKSLSAQLSGFEACSAKANGIENSAMTPPWMNGLCVYGAYPPARSKPVWNYSEDRVGHGYPVHRNSESFALETPNSRPGVRFWPTSPKTPGSALLSHGISQLQSAFTRLGICIAHSLKDASNDCGVASISIAFQNCRNALRAQGSAFNRRLKTRRSEHETLKNKGSCSHD